MHFSTSLLGASALVMFIATTQAQGADPVSVPPPLASDKVSILFYNDNNTNIATDESTFNTCFASENTFSRYSYLNFAPKNSTINFYTDSSCDTFAFGLDGYYGGHPGAARSFKWVGWDEENLGEFFNKEPISGQGDAANPGDSHTAPSGGQNPGTPPGIATPDTAHLGQPESKTPESSTSSSSSTFFGGVVGSMVVLSVGGLIFWKTAGKKLVEDKGKGVLPYNRVGGGRDGDILLTNSRGGHNSFEIGDEDDEEEDEVDTRRQHRSGRQERYHDDQV
ncbi:hypothetical protein BGX23_011944 [Mortierella sp. AD031]|nr:hypothetical protein BGX23_011944 [Mortierella sp. AD031]KAG0217258.1 hypothetical protein BGX33_011017 [Mortierella sp. NVP41]